MLSIIFFYLILPAVAVKLFCKFTYGPCNSKVCLVGKTAIVTGGNKGIGFHTSVGIAARGCKVIIACRSNAQKEVNEMIKMTNNTQISFIHLDLASFRSVQEFSKKIHQEEEKIDILINNAGVSLEHHNYTEDNLHLGMQVNLFSGVLLTYLLLDLLKKPGNARVIFVSSFLLYLSFLTMDQLNLPRDSASTLWNTCKAYINSKMGQAIVAVELSERLKKFGITVNALHPGVVQTGIFDRLHKVDLKFYEVLAHWCFMNCFYYLLKTPEQGAQRTLMYAMSNRLAETTGYVDTGFNWIVGVPRCIKDKKFTSEKFKETERLTGVKFD